MVTGHTRGLGAAIVADLLADPWCRVLGVSRHLGTPLERLDALEADLSHPVLAAGRVEAVLRRVDWASYDRAVLVNNAGLLGPVKPIGSLDAAATAAAIGVDLTAAVLLTDVFLRVTAAHHVERRIAQVSSGASRSAYAGWGVYCAAKAGLDHFTRVLLAEAPPRCRASSVAPGVIDTDMQREIRESEPADFPMHERFVGMHRDGVLLTPAEAAARFVEHLRSDAFGVDAVVDLRTVASSPPPSPAARPGGAAGQ
jgi:benzil reductase ((S)-benzoin forming)